MNFDEFYSKKHFYFSQTYSGGLAECLKKYNVQLCSALDLGAGEGRNSLYLASLGFNVISVEPSEIGAKKIMENALQENLNIKIYNSDFLSISKRLSNLGFVLALTSLEHMEYDYLNETISEIKNILIPGGYVYALVFTEDDPGFKKDLNNASECSLFIKHYFKQNELKEFFSDFDILEYTEYVKKDITHGPAHYHGKAKLFARKPL